MSTVRVGENESVESALKRFKRKCQKDGIIGDLRKRFPKVNFVRAENLIPYFNNLVK